ncbi:MAG: EAL domain-containing protein [Geobacter sp.]|nr:EAL domain-containing protein [Geobacter sp.]
MHTVAQHQIAGRQWFSGENVKPAEIPGQQEKLQAFGIPFTLTARNLTITFLMFSSVWSVVAGLLEQQSRPSALLHAAFAGGLTVITAALLYLLIRRFSQNNSSSHELITRAFHASPNGIAVVRDQDRQILLVNQRFAGITGYLAHEIVGRTDSELQLWENSEERLELIRQIRISGAVQGFEVALRRQDGALFTGAIYAQRIMFEGDSCTIIFLEDITLLKQAVRKVEELTRYDAITGLPNQKLLNDRLSQLLAISNREEQALSVLKLVLGRCPGAISARGNEDCDELLRSVSDRIQQVLRETDTLAVLQKGEFGILLPKTANEREILPVITKLLDAINEPFSLQDAEFQLNAHIGIAIFPSDGRTGEVLLQHAHLAQLQAQSKSVAGESGFKFYAEEMNQAVLEQMQIESSILRGLRAGEFFACYQPLFSKDGKKLVGMEALARWQHPTLGLVGPDKFIPVAEANGAIVQLGDRMLELSLQNCKEWREQGYPHLTVAVNVSTRQLKDRQFAERVARQLQIVGLPPDALCCELTESLLMEHSNENTEQIFRLKELGVGLAIDDFGTGYSSLTYLKHLPVDRIKIDRSFVNELDSNPDDRAIVVAIIAMARSLHLKVTAEGVETPSQHQLLQELGCDTMQGFYFGKPMQREAFEQFLMEGTPLLVDALSNTLVDQAAQELPPSSTLASAQEDVDRSLQNVADITLRIEPLRPADRLNTALERFQTDKRLQVLPVVDQHRVAGVLNRSEFIEEQIVGRIGYAFHINHSKKVRDLMQPVPLVIESDASIEEAAQTLHGNFGSMRLENICVARRGVYLGILDVRTLVEAITALNLKLAKGANPLTGLPGNESIQRETTRRLESGMPFDIAYIDIDNFKPYNDFYGFERGDMVIQVVGDILKFHADELLQGRQARNFCGHIGGDDFIIITGPGHATALSRQVIAEFDARLPLLHGSSDYAKGFYTSFNRKGELETFNLLSLSVAVISTGQLQISSYAQLASMASEVKKTAKKVKGSSVAVKDSYETPSVLLGALSANA